MSPALIKPLAIREPKQYIFLAPVFEIFNVASAGTFFVNLTVTIPPILRIKSLIVIVKLVVFSELHSPYP